MDNIEEIDSHEYFRLDYQHRLPAKEKQRRLLIKERLEEQYNQWQNQEQQIWSAISRPDIVSFLGLDWSFILPTVQRYVGAHSTAFALLSELKLSTVQPGIVISYQARSQTPIHQWLYEQYRHYAIRVQDLGNSTGSEIKRYHVPLIEYTVALGRHPVFFENARPEVVSKILPALTSSFRIVVFPQTRYSFIEDEVFHALYPLPEEQVKIMSHKLLHRFQGTLGYYNALATPFTDSFVQKSYNGREFSYFAAMYPVIDLQFVSDYENQKKSEKFISLIQRQDRKAYPAISQWRYSRNFDFTGESHFKNNIVQGEDCPEAIQTGRALFEYSCADLDTMELDRQQTSRLEGETTQKTYRQYHLLQVDPIWLIVFPASNTICIYRNEKVDTRIDDLLDEVWRQQAGDPDWGSILLPLVDKADKHIGSYEPAYRKRLSKLKFRVYAYTSEDHALVKSISEFVAELTILLEPLQAQVDILRQWRRWQRPDAAQFPRTDSFFDATIKIKEANLNSLKRLREQARESQELLFQLSNTETAHLQSQLAHRMAEETRIQVELALKAERQNKAILIFTSVTVVFIPLSFFTSYFGMNTSDIRGTSRSQTFFWLVAGPSSVAVIVIAMLFAFRDQLRQPSFRRRTLRHQTDEK